MTTRTSKIFAALILAVCLVCPILELFDYWDHTAQTGSDTEYTLVVVGLCLGAAYTFARFLLALPVLKPTTDIILRSPVHGPLTGGGRGSFSIFSIPLTPPALALRI